jgi:hypothetical protein
MKSRFNQYLEKIMPINESSFDDFMTQYGKELNDAVRKVRELINYVPSDESWNKFDKIMQKYDKNVNKQIEHWFSTGHISSRDIASFAIDNMNRYGTEPQMVLFAIDDAARVLKADRSEEKEI